MADKSRVGEFRAKDVEVPLTRILGRQIKIDGFFRHLNAFTQTERGAVLESNRRHYRFTDPQMQPFAIFAAIEGGAISDSLRDEIFSMKPRLPFDDVLDS